MSDHFSDLANGPRARTEQTISPDVWGRARDRTGAHQQRRVWPAVCRSGRQALAGQ
jgi:hypothetical protein